jgi:lysophospholipase L1-like esterase
MKQVSTQIFMMIKINYDLPAKTLNIITISGRLLLMILFFFTCSGSSCSKNEIEPMSPTLKKKYTYLALGDSYTIGEMVAPPDNFPGQVFTLLQQKGIDIQAPRIIAKTGWTTDELETGIIDANTLHPLSGQYDFVSLLIGVNNQYRGRSVDEYRPEFEELLRKAIHFAGGKADHVVVVSIPDWGVTPFAAGRDREQIAREIDAYNAANKQVALRYNIHYIDITPWTREAASDHSLLASDGLHPSGKEYRRWAELIAIYFKSKI